MPSVSSAQPATRHCWVKGSLLPMAKLSVPIVARTCRHLPADVTELPAITQSEVSKQFERRFSMYNTNEIHEAMKTEIN